MTVVVLDRFSGKGNPEDWIFQAEQYFAYLGFPEKDWLPLPFHYFDDEALDWFRWLYRNEQFWDWNHFTKKLVMHFQKQHYAMFSVVDAQITRILDLLQKMEDKYSSTSQHVLVEDAGISATTVLSIEIASPLATENSSPMDDVVSHSELFDNSIDKQSYVDNLFNEMPTEVFTKEVADTSFASSFVADSKDIQSPKALNEFFHSCYPKIVTKVHPETIIEMLDEESPAPECRDVRLFDECFLRNMSKRYTTNTSLDLGSSEQKIVFETFAAKYLPELSLEPDSVHEIPMTLCVWDPGIHFNSMAPIGYTDIVYMDPLQLLEFTKEFCFIDYANSVNQVWDPGQQRSMHSSILMLMTMFNIQKAMESDGLRKRRADDNFYNYGF